MSVFKSAMGYFSSGGANGGSDNEFVGQFVEIGNMKLRVKKVIAEGKFIFSTACKVYSKEQWNQKGVVVADTRHFQNVSPRAQC